MHNRIAALAITAALTLGALTAGCSSNSDGHAKSRPSATPTSATPTSMATTDPAAARQACVDAWAKTIGNRPSDFDPETDTDPEPADCKGLPEDGYTDRYMDGLRESNDAGRERFDHATWDGAWDDFDSDEQVNLCVQFRTDGPSATSGFPQEEAQYFLDNKC